MVPTPSDRRRGRLDRHRAGAGCAGGLFREHRGRARRRRARADQRRIPGRRLGQRPVRGRAPRRGARRADATAGMERHGHAPVRARGFLLDLSRTLVHVRVGRAPRPREDERVPGFEPAVHVPDRARVPRRDADGAGTRGHGRHRARAAPHRPRGCTHRVAAGPQGPCAIVAALGLADRLCQLRRLRRRQRDARRGRARMGRTHRGRADRGGRGHRVPLRVHARTSRHAARPVARPIAAGLRSLRCRAC